MGNRRRIAFMVAMALAVALVVTVANARAGRLARLLVPEAFGMVSAGSGLYVDPYMPEQQRRRLASTIVDAQHQLETFWPDRVTEPVVVACSTDACFRSFGGVSGRGLNFAGRILLGPEGLDRAIIAHEWTHAEFTARVGFMADVPAWFDEGLAVVVSEDARYSAEAAASAHLSDDSEQVQRWETLQTFLQAQNGYLRSGQEVRRWLAVVGSDGLGELVARLADGEAFSGVYAELEAQARAQSAITRLD